MILSTFHLFGVKGFIIDKVSLWQALFSALTFHINWLESINGYLPGNWDVLWSLSVEEMFYVFFPLICIFVRNNIIFMLIMLTFVVLGPISRSMSDTDLWRSQYSYFSCMDAIAIGCLAAIFGSKAKLNPKSSFLLLSLGTFLTLFIFIFRKEAYELGLPAIGLNVTVLALGTALLLISFQKEKDDRKFYKLTKYCKWIASFGKNSYEIYLSHMFVVLFAIKIFIGANLSTNMIPLCYLIIVAFCFCLGELISKYYSEPLNAFLRKDKVSKIDLRQRNHDNAICL